MGYKWDKKKQIDKLYKLYELADDYRYYKRLKSINSSINIYENILFSKNCNSIKGSNKGKNSLPTVEESINNFNYYLNKLPEELRNYLCEFCNNKDTFVINTDIIKADTRSISHKIDNCFTFFKEMNILPQKVEKRILNDNLINITEDKNDFYDKNVVYIDDYYNIPYANILIENTYDDIPTIAHEMAHMIDILENEKIYSTDLWYLYELRSIFSMFYIGDRDSTKRKISNCIGNYNYLQYLKIKNNKLKGLYSLKNSNNFNYNEVAPFNFLLNDITYLFSSVVAIHLINEMINDEEKGKYYLKKSLHSKEDNLVKYAKKINFDLNSPEKGYEQFKNYSNLMDKKMNLVLKR